MDTETLAMCVLDRLICTPEDRRGELGYRDGFINHHVTRAFQERARELAPSGVIVTRSVDARAAMPEFTDALLEAWASLERQGFLIPDDRRRRVLISRAGQRRHEAYSAGPAPEDARPIANTTANDESHVAATAPTAIVLWAHTDPAWNDEERADWRDSVLTLTHLLRKNGIDADVDLFHDHEPTDWSRFGPKRIKSARWVIIAVSDAWRRAFERENEPTSNAGAVGEANALRGMFAAEQSDFERRVVLVLLPGRQIPELPHELPRDDYLDPCLATHGGWDRGVAAHPSRPTGLSKAGSRHHSCPGTPIARVGRVGPTHSRTTGAAPRGRSTSARARRASDRHVQPASAKRASERPPDKSGWQHGRDRLGKTQHVPR